MRGTGRIFQRGRIYWIAYYHRGQEIRESAKTQDRKKAEKLLRERTRKSGTAEFVGPKAEQLTFEDLAAAYLTDYRINGRRSLRDAERAVRRLSSVFAFWRARHITAACVTAYVDARLRDGVGSATVNRELAALRRMFSLAVTAGLLPTRPHIVTLQEPPPREGFFEAPEFARVCAALPRDLANFAMFGYLTGWRKGEIQTLEWRDVDLAGGVIRLRGARSKNRRGRVLVLRGELLEVIRSRAGLRRPDCPLVFHRGGRRIGDFRKAWRKACATAGVETRKFHDFRRSAVRNMVRAGVPERVAMEISGHRTRSVFDRYNIVSEKDLADAAERTAAYVAEEREKTSKITPLHPVKGNNGFKTRTKHGQ